MKDNRLLETEVTQEEWNAIHDAWIAKENEVVDRLNQHPLNQAALELLREAGREPCPVGRLKRLHLLSLAELALPDFDEPGGEEPWMDFNEWTRTVSAMRSALKILKARFGAPEDLLEGEPEEMAREILMELDVPLTD
ncbi:MAG: hypothetical protein M5U12_17520 [Verrucomicrobia bacterium]|nr:hypothetical protein [Verrucomicrobiota bacterium]